MPQPLLDIRELSIGFPVRGTKPLAYIAPVRRINLSITAGEVLGLVGESGSGKSLTALAILGLLPPEARTDGQILFEGADLLRTCDKDLRRRRGADIAMIFQEPMTALNPVMRVGNQIAEAVLAHRQISKSQAWEETIEALRTVAIAEPESRARDYPHQLSGGMRQRVMIAMAVVNRPKLLIADEPTTALDVTIQAQVLELLADLRHRFALSMLFISHDLAVVSRVADRVAVMYAGTLVEIATAQDTFRSPVHPYTRGLLDSVPSLKTDRSRPLRAIEGTVPVISALPPGCAFEPRCRYRLTECARTVPELVEISPGHLVSCPVESRKLVSR